MSSLTCWTYNTFYLLCKRGVEIQKHVCVLLVWYIIFHVFLREITESSYLVDDSGWHMKFWKLGPRMASHGWGLFTDTFPERFVFKLPVTWLMLNGVVLFFTLGLMNFI